MKMLFISSRDVNKKLHGGFQCTNRNYLSFCEIIGPENVEVLDLKSGQNKSFFKRIIKWINYLYGFNDGLSHRIIKDIIAQSKDKEKIFIDTSQFGILAYYLKKAKFKGDIICFFHNVEIKIQMEAVRRNIFKLWRLILTYFNEKNAAKYADRIVALNRRDRAELQKRYGIKNIHIIPISLSDTFKVAQIEFTSVHPTLLFIGNNWYANIHGLNWFVKNVLDHVDIKLQVVGTGMDVLREKYIHPKIEFLGYVPSLSLVLGKADYVIYPIFLGSGMKVKTCEALMYGKNIIGSEEAFEGYEINYHEVGAVCNTKEEFIHTIKHYCSIERTKFNDYSRKCFLEKYSFQATLTKFDDLLLNNKN